MGAQRFSTGLQTRLDWDYAAEFVGIDSVGKHNDDVCPWLKTSFSVLGGVASAVSSAVVTKSALLTVASIGWHEAYINGHRLEAGSVLIPSVSDYRHRILSHQYDVARFLQPGKNTLAFWLAPGWSALSWPNKMGPSGAGGVNFNISKAPLVMAQMSVTDLTLDAKPQVLVKTGESQGWKGILETNTAHIGSWKWADYGGELLNHTKDLPSW
jgi:hypothetical protein